MRSIIFLAEVYFIFLVIKRRNWRNLPEPENEINVCKLILKQIGQGEYIPVNVSRNPTYFHFASLAFDEFEVIFDSLISFGHL